MATREPDPPTQLAGLRRAVESGGLARGYVVRGEEVYFREQAIDFLKGAAAAADYEIRLHDADRANSDFQLARAIEDLSGGGLFASRRFVVLRNAERLLAKVDGKPSPLTRALTAFLAAPEDAGCAVLTGTSLRADLAAVKAIKAAGGELLSLRKLWDSPPAWKPDPRHAELVQWLLGRAREVGVRLDASQAVYVCAATGNDLGALEDQLERLRSSGGRAFREVIGWSAETVPWVVADHLMEGDLPRSLAGIETLFQGGFHEKGGRRLVDETALSAMLLSSLTKGVRSGLALSRELARDPDEKRALREVGFKGAPRTGQTALARARTRSAVAWRSMLEDLARLERRAKTGSTVDANEFTALALRWSRTAPVGRVDAGTGARRIRG